MTVPDRIWLEPDDFDPNYGRTWCEDPDPDDRVWTEYIRADSVHPANRLADALLVFFTTVKAVIDDVFDGEMSESAALEVLREAMSEAEFRQ